MYSEKQRNISSIKVSRYTVRFAELGVSQREHRSYEALGVYEIYDIYGKNSTGYRIFFLRGGGGEAKGYGIFLDQKLLEYGILRYPLPPCPQPYNGVSLILLSDWRRFTHREILLKK